MDITNVINSVLSIVVTLVFAYLGKTGHDNRKAQELNEAISIAEKYAKDIVITLSQKGNIPNSQKFKQAYIFVVNKLKEQNIHVSAETIENKINSAYQLYKMDGGDIHKFIPDFANQTVSEVEQSIVTPESRMATPAQVSQTVQPSTDVKEDTQDDPVEKVVEAGENKETIDVPKSDAPVSDEGVQHAPNNPYEK